MAARWFEQFAVSGVLVGSTADWAAAGVTKRKLGQLVAAGQVVRVRRGAYAASGLLAQEAIAPGLAYAVEVAAVRATGKHAGSVVSHHAAARMHGMSVFSESSWKSHGVPPLEPAGTRGQEKVALTVPPGTPATHRTAEDVAVHLAALPRKHVTDMFFGVPVTTGARTVVDIARLSTFMEAVVTADSALGTGSATQNAIRRVLEDCKGWPGVERAREVAAFATNLSESVLESCARVVFRDQGLPPPELQVLIPDKEGRIIARPDFCWSDYGTLADADGMLKYQGKQDMARHLNRDSLLDELGWDDIHFTWAQLFGASDRVVSRIRNSLARGTRLGRRAASPAQGWHPRPI